MAAQQIVIVGGGAGGLVLATRLGQRLGRAGLAQVLLVDVNLTHVWKPLLHEIAAGTLNVAEDAVFYLSHAATHGFRFVQGCMSRLDRGRREIGLAPIPGIHGHGAVPERVIPYDILVLAYGSVSNDFGVPGVQEHCVFLDGQRQAEELQQRILYDCLQAQAVRRGHGAAPARDRHRRRRCDRRRAGGGAASGDPPAGFLRPRPDRPRPRRQDVRDRGGAAASSCPAGAAVAGDRGCS